MRGGVAFTFAQELVGDCIHILTLSQSPGVLAFEAGLEALRAGCNVFSLVLAKRTTKELQEIKAREYMDAQIQTYVLQLEEKRNNLERQYRALKQREENQQLRDKQLMELGSAICGELKKLADAIARFQPELTRAEYGDAVPTKELDRLHETARRAMRDYQNIQTYILGDGGEQNGKSN